MMMKGGFPVTNSCTDTDTGTGTGTGRGTGG
jgi:hypothetical protein